MARLYANENFPLEVVIHLRALGHDVLTTHEAGKSNQRIEDDAVLAFAIASGRSVITLNRRDFVQLHRLVQIHSSIIVCTADRDFADFAQRVDAAITEAGELANRLVRVVRGKSD